MTQPIFSLIWWRPKEHPHGKVKETLKKDETYADTRRASPSEVSLHKQEHSLHARQHPEHEMMMVTMMVMAMVV